MEIRYRRINKIVRPAVTATRMCAIVLSADRTHTHAHNIFFILFKL